MELDLVREELLPVELDAAVDDPANRIARRRKRAADVQESMPELRDPLADLLGRPVLDVVVELVDLVVERVDQIEVVLGDLVHQVVRDHSRDRRCRRAGTSRGRLSCRTARGPEGSYARSARARASGRGRPPGRRRGAPRAPQPARGRRRRRSRRAPRGSAAARPRAARARSADRGPARAASSVFACGARLASGSTRSIHCDPMGSPRPRPLRAAARSGPFPDAPRARPASVPSRARPSRRYRRR